MEQKPAQAQLRRLTSRIRDTRMRYGISVAARAEMRRERRTRVTADFQWIARSASHWHG